MSAQDHMVKIEGVPGSEQAVPGMAYFAGTGPFARTCGECIHRGYSRQSTTGRWDEATQQMMHRSYRVQGCAEFKRLAGHHGPAVDSDNEACKYFKAKPDTASK